MTIKAFAEQKKIPFSKAKQMAPYLAGAAQCPYCKKWEISEIAKPIYIPNKSFYKLRCKKLCYVLDAISLGHIIHPDLSMVGGEEFQKLIQELLKAHYIRETRKNGNAYDCENYSITIEGYNWFEATTEQKNSMATEIISALLKIAPSLLPLFRTKTEI